MKITISKNDVQLLNYVHEKCAPTNGRFPIVAIKTDEAYRMLVIINQLLDVLVKQGVQIEYEGLALEKKR